jgi:hypothetical protein
LLAACANVGTDQRGQARTPATPGCGSAGRGAPRQSQ